jgi:hypothetical protein
MRLAELALAGAFVAGKPSQERALVALLAEPSITAAARAAKVGERTLRRWIVQPAFADFYRAKRRVQR